MFFSSGETINAYGGSVIHCSGPHDCGCARQNHPDSTLTPLLCLISRSGVGPRRVCISFQFPGGAGPLEPLVECLGLSYSKFNERVLKINENVT